MTKLMVWLWAFKNVFLITMLALRFGFDTVTILSPCSPVKTQQLSFCTTSITVTQILNSPLNLKITVRSLCWTFLSNATAAIAVIIFRLIGRSFRPGRIIRLVYVIFPGEVICLEQIIRLTRNIHPRRLIRVEQVIRLPRNIGHFIRF